MENASIKKLWVSFQFFKRSGRELDRFTGKLIQSSIGEFRGMAQVILLENSYRPFVTYDMVYIIPYMVSVKKSHGWLLGPENENFRKNSGWIFHDLTIRVKLFWWPISIFTLALGTNIQKISPTMGIIWDFLKILVDFTIRK